MFATKSLDSKTITGEGSCGVIATDGKGVYLEFTDKKEIKHWKSWDDDSYGTWSFVDMQSPGALFLDEIGHQLLLADRAGKLNSVSITDGKSNMLTDNIGWANAIVAYSKHIAVASGKKFYSSLGLTIAERSHQPISSP